MEHIRGRWKEGWKIGEEGTRGRGDVKAMVDIAETVDASAQINRILVSWISYWKCWWMRLVDVVSLQMVRLVGKFEKSTQRSKLYAVVEEAKVLK